MSAPRFRRDAPMAESSSSKSKIPGWVWLFTGTILGAFIMFLMRLSELQPGSPYTGDQSTDTGSRANATSSDDRTEPRFDFYKLLRETEVPVLNKKEAPTPAPNNSEYLLQVASFKAMSDAEQVRAELTLLNLSARIEAANVNSGETWHRVIVGPFESRSQLAKARNTLLSNRYEAMTLTRKKSG